MSREDNARAAVQALIPDDEILDVALTYPRGFTKSQAVGMAAGGAIGFGSDFQGVAAVMGGVVGGKIFSNLKELPQSFVLAISPTMVYVLGRDKQSAFGGWDRLQPMVKFDRSTLHVELQQTLVTLNITLVDTANGATLELESKRLGTLDVKALLELMMMSNAHIDDAADDEDARTE
jgi:hypothetical protein